MTGIFGRALFATIVAAALGTSVADAGQAVALKPSPAIRRGVAAFPRLVAKPGDEVASRINRALKKADDVAVEGMCKDYSRQVRVTMRGPRYLSLLASDSWYCGGAYPDSSERAPVYDLATGAPADWKKMLSAALIETAATSPGGGDGDPVLVTSSTLWNLYAKRAQQGNKACADVFADATTIGTGLMVWLDAKADGLGLQAWDWPHVVKACAAPITVATAELRRLGVQAAFLDAIDEAHRRGWYDKPTK